MKKIKEVKGITLIALVITIAILLILAGVTISAIFNKEGMLQNARELSYEVTNKQDRRENELDRTIDETEDAMLNIDAVIHQSVTWSNEKATLTLKLLIEGYNEMQYKVERTLATQKYSSPIPESINIPNLLHDDKVEIKLTKAGVKDWERTVTVKDEIKPLDATINLSKTEVSIGENVTATVTHADNESGVSIGNSKYIYNTTQNKLGIDSTQWNSATAFSSNGQTITLTASEPGKYYLHVLTVDKGGNKKETVSQEVEVLRGKLAKDITPDDYGKTVTNYDSDTQTEWQIFYADDNIYLISADYIPYVDLPLKNGYAMTRHSTYSAHWESSQVYKQYTGSAAITDQRLRNLNKAYYDHIGTKNVTFSNIKSVAYMMDIEIWSDFKDNSIINGNNTVADYAIGGPTIELFLKSYNKKYNSSFKYKAVTANGGNIGYQMSKNNSSYLAGQDLDKAELPYVITSTTKAMSMWLASTGGGGLDTNGNPYTYCMMIVRNNGYVGTINHGSGDRGFRPVVCLNKDVRLEWVNNSYSIVKL